VKPAKAVASFDSATGMLRALSRYLHGRDIPLIGQAPTLLEPVLASLLGAVNATPRRLQERVYAVSGWAEAIPTHQTAEIRSDELAAWVVDYYPRRLAAKRRTSPSALYDEVKVTDAELARPVLAD
jgi:hypothetical protein